jgi:hypothetical protein
MGNLLKRVLWRIGQRVRENGFERALKDIIVRWSEIL